METAKTTSNELIEEGKVRRGRKKREGGNESGGNNLLGEILLKVNEGIRTRISKDIVINYALLKLTDSDINKIRMENITSEDKVLLKFEEFKAREGNTDLDFYDFLAKQLKIPN